MEKRWGGWYVTGSHGSIRHLGNMDLDRVFDTPPSASTLNWPSLDGKFDSAGYLTKYSDIVALMVFEHQMHMMNQKDSEAVPLDAAASEVVDYLLFVDEATLADEIHGSSGFAEAFASQGPHDSKGRSLRQLDLRRRLMRYPCSYMIYSPVFDALPGSARDAIYRRMWQVLSGAEKDPKYARLSLTDRQAIVEILRDTKKDLPAFFRPIAH